MRLSLRLAEDDEVAFCESVTRSNMGHYLQARGTTWNGHRFRSSWGDLENLMILADSQVAGLLRLAREGDALGLRDLQILPNYQRLGIGSWAIRQAQSIATDRGLRCLRLRVYEENPALALYARLGFNTRAVAAGKIHMEYQLPPNNSFKGMPLRGTP